MSSTDEKRIESSIKSSHKKDKKNKKNSDPTSLPSPTTEVAMGITAEDDATAKALKKAEKKQKKALKRAAADGDVSTGAASVTEDEPPAKKAKKAEAEQAEAAPVADDDKAAKKARKEAKKAAKKAAAAAPSSSAAAAPSAASTSKALTSAPVSSTTDAGAANAFLTEHNISLEAPEDSDEKAPLPFLAFNELRGKVDDRICDEFDRLKFEKPTPIQACCWPVLLSGKDVVGIAETGSGKTFAFGVPALQKLVLSGSSAAAASSNGKKKGGKKAGGSGSPNVSVLVIAPTRELAKQTHDNLLMLAPSLGFGSVCLYGGVPRGEQERELYGSPSVRIVVGTPGRVLDLARDGVLDLSGVSYLVLDEADRMLDKGFEPDIRAIIGMTQSHEQGRHTSMFSATWPPAVRGLAETFMKGPIRVTVGSDELTANRRVEQTVEVLENDNRAKERRVMSLLRQIGAGPKGRNAKDKILIFALYKKEASRLEENLRRNGFSVVGIHGDMSQPQRMASLESFKTGETPILVATDVAARGLDIPNVAHVISVTMSLTVEDYVHRIGRTARGGKSGKSTLFFTEEEKHLAGQLVRVLKDANQPVPDALMAFPQTIKKKTHSAYGDHFGELVPGKAKKITFD